MSANDVATVLEALRHHRAVLVANLVALENTIKGMDIAIALLTPPRWGTVTDTILGILADAPEGLKPKQVIAAAAERGIAMNRGSVYALLNRLEKLGRVVHGDKGYMIRPTSPPSLPSG